MALVLMVSLNMLNPKNQPKITVRPYQASDAESLASIYYHTIHQINSKDYNEEQIASWAPKSCLEVAGWRKKWQKLAPIVAICGAEIIGFAEFEDSGHIDCFYVHHLWQGKGVGKALMTEIEKRAADKNIDRIFAEVSITAEPFFKKMGFVAIKEQLVEIRGVKLKNFVMEKSFLKAG